MEGVGSRLGRASSRYGSSSAVFSGPVRKWKRRWVHVSSQSNPTSRSNNNHNNSSPLVLCRWTPISPAQSDDNSVNTEEPPRRKFRYVPIVVLEDQKQEAYEKVDDKAKARQASSRSDDIFEIPNTEGASTEEIKAANKTRLTKPDSHMSNLNLDLGLKGHNGHQDSDGKNAKAGKSGLD